MKHNRFLRYPKSGSDHVHVDFLASGSDGNCTLLRFGSFTVAVDAGISSRALVRYLSRFGQTDEAGNPCLDGVFLTHTHKDHVNRSALNFVLENGVRLFAHVDHMPALEDLDSENFAQLRESGLLTAYTMRVFEPFPHLQVLPLPLSHDCRATHGFVFHFAQGAVRVG